MAKQPRKLPQSKPIAQHQLFPAVVALWFGALFGLGSLAVRPSLLESLVINSRIDLIVPAAAPPLGVTARILVALVLAAIGSAIGIAIARRLARPKVEVRERKRSKLAVDEAPVRRPFGTSFDSSEDAAIIAPRRRALALEPDQNEFVPHDMAPLPGGAPQILDISSVGFRTEPVDAPLDLSAFPAPAAAEPPRQVFQPFEPAPQPQSILPEPEPFDAHPAAEVAAAAADGRQVFGMAPVADQHSAPRQIFGQPIEGDRVSEDFVKAAGFQTTVFETPEPNPLFPPRDQAQPAVAPAFAVPQPYEVPPAPEVQAFAVPTAEVPPSSFEIAAQMQVPQPNQPDPVATPPLTSPAGLGMDDLAARLAESMARRRAARAGTAMADEPAAALAEPPVISPPIPQAFTPEPAQPAPMPQAFAPEPVAPVEAEPAAIPQPIMPDPVMTSPIPAMPAAMRPLELGGFEDDNEPLDHLLPPRHIAMPPVLAPVAAPAALVSPAEPIEETEAEVAEESYGSLLGIAPASMPRSGFVRIDEAEAATIEPVVIFPGQMAQPAPQTPFRPFDAPASAGQGQLVSAGEATPSVDREEADRALRMALANLQRMSGAA